MKPDKFFVGVKGLIIKDNKLLLLKKNAADPKIDQEFWDLPGGRIAIEEGLKPCLRRELQEELPGISQVEIGRLVWAYPVPRPIFNDNYLILLYYQVEADVSQSGLSDEHTVKKWVGVKQFADLKLPVNRNLERVLAELTGQNHH